LSPTSNLSPISKLATVQSGKCKLVVQRTICEDALDLALVALTQLKQRFGAEGRKHVRHGESNGESYCCPLPPAVIVITRNSWLKVFIVLPKSTEVGVCWFKVVGCQSCKGQQLRYLHAHRPIKTYQPQLGLYQNLVVCWVNSYANTSHQDKISVISFRSSHRCNQLSIGSCSSAWMACTLVSLSSVTFDVECVFILSYRVTTRFDLYVQSFKRNWY
jgi:hypothetical protein